MNKLYLLTLLLAVASAKMSIDITTITNTDTLHCLAIRTVTKGSIEILSQTGVINQNFMNAWIYAQDAGFTQVDAVAVVNDHNDADFFSANVTHALPSRFSGVLWLKVLSSSQLWSQDKSKRIPYLENLVLGFKQRGIKAGVYSDYNSWSVVFDSQDAGSDTLKAAPVWYVGNSDSSFNDFSYAGFGTWTTPNQKLNQENVNICNILTMLNYYEK